MTRESFVDIDTFKEVIYKVCPNFEIDKQNKEILNELYKYINGNSEILDSKKGIWFWGTIDTGKSTLMRILAESQRTVDRGFKCVNCSDKATKYSAIGLDALKEDTTNETTLSRSFNVGNVSYLSSHNGNSPVERGFDEVGREPIPAKHFGNDLNVMQYIFGMRYELRDSVKTHVTTNIAHNKENPKEDGVFKLYGEYIYSRANEMFNFIEVKGSPRR